MSNIPLRSFERMNYYLEQLLTSNNFISEQNYMNEKRQLINRLKIPINPETGKKTKGLEVKKEKGMKVISISPGVAIDGKGREIVISEVFKRDVTGMEGTVYVSLQYDESMKNTVPPRDPCSNQEDCNRVKECFKVLTEDEPPNDPEDDYVFLKAVDLDEERNFFSGTSMTSPYGYTNALLFQLISNMEKRIFKLQDTLDKFLKEIPLCEDEDQTSH